jgi:ABC-2 type transport system ATP-binding protein
MSESVITARGLTKRYGETVVVDSLDFDIRKGETFGLLGPNGAGKTTTILMLLGLTEISGGEVTVVGHDPVREPLAVKRRVGYLPDQVGFYDNMTATENLAYTGRLMGFPRESREMRIAEGPNQLVQFLAAFGNAFGRNAYMQAGGSHHYPNLFVCVVGKSSKARKGTA